MKDIKKSDFRRIAVVSGVLCVFLLNLLAFSSAYGSEKEQKEQTSEDSKKNNYISDGTFSGGSDKEIPFQIIDLKASRESIHQPYERLVLVLEVPASEQGKVPHYQLVVAPEKNKANLSLWGRGEYQFKKEKLKALVRKNRLLKRIFPVPIVEKNLTVLEFEILRGTKIEVFPLYSGASQSTDSDRIRRIVLDFKK